MGIYSPLVVAVTVSTVQVSILVMVEWGFTVMWITVPFTISKMFQSLSWWNGDLQPIHVYNSSHHVLVSILVMVEWGFTGEIHIDNIIISEQVSILVMVEWGFTEHFLFYYLIFNGLTTAFLPGNSLSPSYFIVVFLLIFMACGKILSFLSSIILNSYCQRT